MSVIVSLVGVLAAVIGLIGLAKPQNIVRLVEFCDVRTRYRLAIGMRLVLGVAFLVVAPACRLPVLVQAVGVISIFAAIAIYAIGREKLDSFIEWWLSHKTVIVRLSALFAFAFGVLLVYAG